MPSRLLTLAFVLGACAAQPQADDAARGAASARDARSAYDAASDAAIPSTDAGPTHDAVSPVAPRGTPAWPLEIFDTLRTRAYPGIRYDARLAVIGGVFPYRFVLTTAPDGMTIDDHGAIRWPAAVAGSATVSVEVHDAVGATASQTITLVVSTDDFYFVSPGGMDTATRDGSIGSPWRTIGYALTRSLSPDAILYLRDGDYTQGHIALTDETPSQFLGYPDEHPAIDMNQEGWSFTASSHVGRFEGLELFGMLQYGIYTENNLAGMVVRNCAFHDGAENPDIASENPAFIHAAGHNEISAYHRHFVIQDNTFRDFRLTAGGGTVSQTSGAVVYFDVWESLFENNVITNIEHQGIVDKDDSSRNTYRENYVAGTARSGIAILGQAGAHEIDIHHNLLDGVNLEMGNQGQPISNVYVHHNTIVGGAVSLGWSFTDPATMGVELHFNVVSRELSTVVAPVFWGNLITTGTWYFAPMIGRFTMDDNLLFAGGPILFGAEPDQGAHIDELTESQLRDHDLETRGIDGRAGLVGSGPALRIPTTSPYFGVYGHGY